MGRLSIIETEAKPVPFASASRAALAAAIDLANTQREQEANARIALKRATARVAELGNLLHAAHGAITSAMEADASRAAQAAASGASFVTDKALREARAAEAELRDELDAAKGALAHLEGSVDGAEEASRKAEQEVAGCARAVVADEIPRLLDAAISAQQYTVNLRVALRSLLRDLKMDGPAIEQARHFLRYNHDMPTTYGAVEYRDWDHHPASGPWREFYYALLKDPHAKAPAV